MSCKSIRPWLQECLHECFATARKMLAYRLMRTLYCAKPFSRRLLFDAVANTIMPSTNAEVGNQNFTGSISDIRSVMSMFTFLFGLKKNIRAMMACLITTQLLRHYVVNPSPPSHPSSLFSSAGTAGSKDEVSGIVIKSARVPAYPSDITCIPVGRREYTSPGCKPLAG